MNIPEISNSNIQSFLNREDIIHDTMKQIMKDFGMFGVELTYPGKIENAYQELMDQLVDQINHLANTNSERLSAILYQVDISPKDIDRTEQELPHYNQVEVIAHQVILRDLKKVLYRRYFSGKL